MASLEETHAAQAAHIAQLRALVAHNRRLIREATQQQQHNQPHPQPQPQQNQTPQPQVQQPQPQPKPSQKPKAAVINPKAAVALRRSGGANARQPPIDQASWFFGSCSREVAEQILARAGPGFFLARMASAATGSAGSSTSGSTANNANSTNNNNNIVISCCKSSMATSAGLVITHALVGSQDEGGSNPQQLTVAPNRSATDAVLAAAAREQLSPLSKFDDRLEPFMLHPDWRATLTPEGKKYYYNRFTRASSWKPVYRHDVCSLDPASVQKAQQQQQRQQQQQQAPHQQRPQQPKRAVLPPAAEALKQQQQVSKRNLRQSDRAVAVSKTDPSMVELKVCVSRVPLNVHLLNLPRAATVFDGLAALGAVLRPGIADWAHSHEFLLADMSRPQEPAAFMDPSIMLLSFPLTAAHEIELHGRTPAASRNILLTVECPSLALTSVLSASVSSTVADLISQFALTTGMVDKDIESLGAKRVSAPSDVSPARLRELAERVGWMQLEETLLSHYVKDGDVIVLSRRGGGTRERERRVSREDVGPVGEVFGVNPATLPCEQDGPFSEIPTVLLKLKRSLIRHDAYNIPGLFSVASHDAATKDMKLLLTSGKFVDVRSRDPEELHACASLIRRWFGELPSPLLNSLTLEQVSSAVDPTAGSDVQCALLADGLPSQSRNLLAWFLDLLSEIALRDPGCEADLAACVAPSLFRKDGQNPFSLRHTNYVVATFLESLIGSKVSAKRLSPT